MLKDKNLIYSELGKFTKKEFICITRHTYRKI